MLFIVIAALLSFSLTSAREVEICNEFENEEFHSCGTECQATCLTLFEPGRACSDVCVQGCFCREGFVRSTESGSCIPIEACKNVPRCPKNEIYSSCGPYCPPTCNDREPKICPEICVEGCICTEGYVRKHEGGPCVPKNTCNLQICGPHQVFKQCGSDCPKTCNHLEPRICDERCVTGCFCVDGYVLDEDTQECVKPRKCPIKSA